MSNSIEDYLEALYDITGDGGAASTSEVSRRLKVAPASVTQMLKKLDEKGYIRYSPYQGAVLTPNGFKMGEKMTRRHRLMECFLHDVLKLGTDVVHAQAAQMEHALSDETERAFCKLLKHPARCPDDGKPIPPCDLQFDNCDACFKWSGGNLDDVGKRPATLVAVSGLKMQQSGQVSFVRGDIRLVRRLQTLGLTPGAMLTVTRIAPLRGPAEIEVSGSHVPVSEDIAANVFVKAVGEPEHIEDAREALSATNRRLEESNRQNSIVSEMMELLQACSTVQEMPPIVTMSLSRLFPGIDGALFLVGETRTDLQSIARWGEFPEEADGDVFKRDDCWGLRRGRIHTVENTDTGLVCPHLKRITPAPYMCLPLIAKGDILGLLHLRRRSSGGVNGGQEGMSALREGAAALAEYLSLAIANARLREKLVDESIRDPLTGLFNRRYLEETIHREILRAGRKKTGLGVVMADIDHFKKFNDTYGHEAGDSLLVELAGLFKANLRGSDIVCRYGGEEFILILPDCSAEDARTRAEHIAREAKKMYVHSQGRRLPPVTLSMGIAVYPDHGTKYDELIRLADAALYKAKSQGRDKVVVS